MWWIVSAVLISITFSGCSWCTQVEYVDREVEVLVKTPCIVPEANCTNDLQGTDGEVVAELLKCIVNQKEVAKVCQDKRDLR